MNNGQGRIKIRQRATSCTGSSRICNLDYFTLIRITLSRTIIHRNRYFFFLLLFFQEKQEEIKKRSALVKSLERNDRRNRSNGEISPSIFPILITRSRSRELVIFIGITRDRYDLSFDTFLGTNGFILRIGLNHRHILNPDLISPLSSIPSRISPTSPYVKNLNSRRTRDFFIIRRWTRHKSSPFSFSF